ncbi:OLC1v1008847C1 [Oldenlandia corymbosa var. corymbosa]|uniref:OLC1v1008847C1 n=1 Tax=Oldenlandia corymbosa var. corymbosa TaxID=529605 RepID=A0AAV1DP27_OLDCO|nr:OLC1v1008847C1 [Oldenlandia corymbosa var. corymbosa]
MKLGKDWCVVQKANPRSSYEVLESEQGPVDEIIQEEEPGFVLCVNLGEIPQLVRDVPSLNNIDATIVNTTTAETCIENDYDDEFIDDEDCDVDCGDEALANGFVENEGLWTDDDDYVDDDSPGKGRKPLVKKRRLESLGLRDSVSSQETPLSNKCIFDSYYSETHLAGDSGIPLTPMSACSAHWLLVMLNAAKSSTFVKRGPTRNLSGRKNDDDAPHKVKLDDCYKRVVGPESQSFINESSAIACKFGKHNVPKWSQLEKEDREAMCQRVMAKFPNDVVDAKMKKAVEQQVNKSYRNCRHKHSRLFKTFKSKEEALRQVPDELPKEEWIYLCNYFTSEKFKAMSKRNIENRAKNKEPNFTGTLSLARFAEQLERIRNEKRTPFDLFEYSRTLRKTGTMPGETSKTTLGQMRDLESASYEPKEICIATVGKLPRSAGRALTKSYYVEEVRREKERADVAEKERKETDAKLEKMAVEQETLEKNIGS